MVNFNRVIRATQVTHVFVSRKSRSFLWSLNPIFTWMRFIGIELNYKINRPNWRRNVTMLIGFLLLTFNICTNVIRLFMFFNKTDLIDGTGSFNVRNGVDLLEEMNEAVISLAPHIAFIIMVHSDWKKLFDTMQQIESSFALNRPMLYRRCRKISIAGMVFFTVVIQIRNQSRLSVVEPNLNNTIMTFFVRFGVFLKKTCLMLLLNHKK